MSKQKEMEDAGYKKLTNSQVMAIFDQGFCYIEISPGSFIKMTKEDLHFNTEEIDELINAEKRRKLGQKA